MSFKSHLLTSSSAKLNHSQGGDGFYSVALYLAPARTAGGKTVCPASTAGCEAACLHTAGRGGIIVRGQTDNAIIRARIRRTRAFLSDRATFMADLVSEIERAESYATRHGLRLAVRLNGTSDLPWEAFKAIRYNVSFVNIMAAFPSVQFYDYTKVSSRLGKTPENYHLTLSRSEANESEVERAIASGHNVAVVFRNKVLPETYMGRPVFGGDDSDRRFLDPQGVIVGLYAKGRARRDTSGFVVH